MDVSVGAPVSASPVPPDNGGVGGSGTSASGGTTAAEWDAVVDAAIVAVTGGLATPTGDFGELSSASSSLSAASPGASADEDDTCEGCVQELVVYNTATCKYHLDAENGRLVDGKPFPLSFRRLRAVPPGGKLCAKCF